MANYRYELSCPNNNKACKYQPECPISSVHHITPRRFGAVAIGEALEAGDDDLAHLIKRFINSWYNKVRVGRCIHDFLDELPQPLPDREKMERIVYESQTKP